eukprot:c4492_g1_i1 orf=171-422(-)
MILEEAIHQALKECLYGEHGVEEEIDEEQELGPYKVEQKREYIHNSSQEKSYGTYEKLWKKTHVYYALLWLLTFWRRSPLSTP